MLSGLIDGSGKLGMDQQRQARPGDMRQCGAQLGLGDHGETFDSGINEKALETSHAGSRQRFDLVLIGAGIVVR